MRAGRYRVRSAGAAAVAMHQSRGPGHLTDGWPVRSACGGQRERCRRSCAGDARTAPRDWQAYRQQNPDARVRSITCRASLTNLGPGEIRRRSASPRDHAAAPSLIKQTDPAIQPL